MSLNTGLTADRNEIDKLKKAASAGGYIGLAQLNPIAGNLEYNALKIAEYIKYSDCIGLDMVVFPELALMGYPIEDTIDRHPFLVDENIKWLSGLARVTRKTAAIVGFVEPRKECKSGKRFFNSAAILRNGQIEGIVRKSLLPNYSEFNDYRYMEPSPAVGVQPADTLCKFDINTVKKCSPLYELNGIKYGITICEDIWNNKDFFERNLYQTEPVSVLKNAGADVIINCSASPTRAKKEQLKHNLLAFTAFSNKIPIVYVNQVGAIDNISFDGSSRCVGKYGDLFARAKSFEEDFIIVNPMSEKGEIQPLTGGLSKSLNEQKIFTLEYESDLERTYKTVIQGIRDYFKKCNLKRAVLGLSGGLDSTVCAVLLADALGKENVLGVSMPSVLTSDESKSDAATLAKNLGIKFIEEPIKPMVDVTNGCLNNMFNKIEKFWENRYTKSFTPDNVQARSRAMFLWGISNEFPACIPIATSDKSELYMGYATINGDMSGGFAPIADIPKTKLFALARWLNKNREIKNVIPDSVILKKPGAELAIDPKTGKTLNAEDALMPYEFLDEIIWRIENKNESYKDFLNIKFEYENKIAISREQKIEWLDKFYYRMSKALYKWSILPPSVIVEARSINKSDYRQPITTDINYKGVDEKYICQTLKR